jgi:hypothetical protein
MVEERRSRPVDASAPAERALLETEALKAQEMEPLIRVGDGEREAWREREHFKSEHRLARKAQYPDAIFLTVFMLVVVTLVETALNAFVFGSASEHGYIGGFTQAFIFASINVLAGTALGFMALRNLEHQRTWRKCVGGGGLLLGVAFAVLWNLGIAHYREVISANPDILVTQGFIDGGADVIDRMKADLFGIHSMPGWALFVLGVLAFGFAAWKGYIALDDRYPGYGKIDRLFRNAQTAYAAQKNELKSGVAALFTKERDGLDERVHNDFRAAAEVSEIKKQMLQRAREYRDAAVDLRRACKAALMRYREVNGQVRDPFAPPPAYFATFPDFEVNLPDPAPFDAAIERTMRSFEQCASTILEARKRLADAEQRAIGEFDEFFRHVEQEAAKRWRAREADKSWRSQPSPAETPELTLLPPETV